MRTECYQYYYQYVRVNSVTNAGARRLNKIMEKQQQNEENKMSIR